MPQIICDHVTLGYENRPILKDLSFSVESGEYLCILGENGSGKSTLMKTMLALTPPLSGTIRMEEGLKPTQIGYLPQQTQVQRDFPASVREIVCSGLQGRSGWRPWYTREEKAAAAQAMESMGITSMAGRCYRELSGGQQQRVLLARALCAAGKCLVLDEPVSGLDPKVTAELYEHIDRLHRSGITIIMISHDLEAAMRYADHILHIGDTVFFGTRDEYIRSRQGMGFLNGKEHAHA